MMIGMIIGCVIIGCLDNIFFHRYSRIVLCFEQFQVENIAVKKCMLLSNLKAKQHNKL